MKALWIMMTRRAWFSAVCGLALGCLPASGAPADTNTMTTLLSYHDELWYGSTFWSGPDWTRVGKTWQHPGENTPSVRRFTAPRDGQVTISGRVFKLHLNGDGIRAIIRHNEREIWKVEIEGKDDKGVEPRLTLEVKKGDALRFIIHKRGTIACDTTGWDPVVTYADGERFQASLSFAANTQGAGGWFYEMLGNGEAPLRRPVAPVPSELKQELTRLADSLAPATDPDLLLLALEEWWRDDKITDTPPSYAAAIKDHFERTQKLVAEFGDKLKPELQRAAVNASAIGVQASACSDLVKLRSLYLQTRLLKREVALGNPILNFNQLLFCKRAQPSYSHLVGQYFGWRQRPGGGLFVLEHPGRSLAVRDLAGAQLPAGSCLEPCVSFDARRIAFSFVACPPKTPDSKTLPVNEDGPAEAYFHLYEINADGAGLRQLTDGCYDDMMPCYLPDGGIAFVSTRRRGYSRCFGPNFSNRWHSYTLHRVNADGSGLRILSLNDVSEWFPSVAHDGQILFARWDYIDRDAVTHQNLWVARPDGTSPAAVWGNATPKPHCTFQAKPIPGSHKIVFIASAHHAVTGGPVCVLDPTVDPNSQAAITRITPGPYPEAESSRIEEYYASPWPLSENYFLVAYSPARLVFALKDQPIAAVADEEIFFRERPRRGVILGDLAALCLRIGPRCDARDRVLAVRVHGRIEHADRPARDRVVRRSNEGDLPAAGDGLSLESAVRFRRRVAPDRGGIGAVGVYRPEVLVGDGVAINVVPAREQNLAGIGDGREPFADVVEGEDAQAGAVGVHPVQRVAVPAVAEARPEAARIAAPPRRDEREAAIGQPARHQVVVAAARELAQSAAIDADRIDVEVSALVALLVDRQRLRIGRLRRAGDKRERDGPAVIREARLQIAAGGQLVAHDVADGERAADLFQHA